MLNQNQIIIITLSFVIIASILLSSYSNRLVYNRLTETFQGSQGGTTYARCDKYSLGEVLNQLMKENQIKKDNINWDLYVPCGYNRVEEELKRLKPANADQKIFGIGGCDSIVSKNSLWELLKNKYGRQKASEFTPETYNISDPEQMKLFKRVFNPKQIYILKKNIQRQEGIKISNNLREILELIKNENFRVIQPLLPDPFIVNKRKINFRIYLLIVCHKDNIKAYTHHNGFMYYTPKAYQPNKVDRDMHITTGYIDRNVYEENPLTLENFRKYLNYNGYDSDLLDHNVKQLFRRVMDAIKTPLCNIKSLKNNTSFQLFGCDIAPDRNLEVKLIECNKGPSMQAMDDRDKELKLKVQKDILNLTGLINMNEGNQFNLVWEK